ncbi:hypothetical protein [Nocardia sp. NPDC004722]
MPERYIEFTWTRTQTQTFTYKQPLPHFIDDYSDELGGNDPKALSADEIAKVVDNDLSDLEEEYCLVESDSDVEFVSHRFI